MNPMNQRERERAAARVHADRLRRWILAYLGQHGPTECVQIARDLGEEWRRLVRIGALLLQRGMIFSYPKNPPLDETRVWSLQPPPPSAPKKTTYKKPAVSIGLDPENLAWMQYWSARRAARQICQVRERTP
jgi:hypothetical protein